MIQSKKRSSILVWTLASLLALPAMTKPSFAQISADDCGDNETFDPATGTCKSRKKAGGSYSGESTAADQQAGSVGTLDESGSMPGQTDSCDEVDPTTGTCKSKKKSGAQRSSESTWQQPGSMGPMDDEAGSSSSRATD